MRDKGERMRVSARIEYNIRIYTWYNIIYSKFTQEFSIDRIFYHAVDIHEWLIVLIYKYLTATDNNGYPTANAPERLSSGGQSLLNLSFMHDASNSPLRLQPLVHGLLELACWTRPGCELNWPCSSWHTYLLNRSLSIYAVNVNISVPRTFHPHRRAPNFLTIFFLIAFINRPP